MAESYASEIGFKLSGSDTVGFTLSRWFGAVGLDDADQIYFILFEGLTLETAIAICDGANRDSWASLDDALVYLRADDESHFVSADRAEKPESEKPDEAAIMKALQSATKTALQS
jgi:hypothetical protein